MHGRTSSSGEGLSITSREGLPQWLLLRAHGLPVKVRLLTGCEAWHSRCLDSKLCRAGCCRAFVVVCGMETYAFGRKDPNFLTHVSHASPTAGG